MRAFYIKCMVSKFYSLEEGEKTSIEFVPTYDGMRICVEKWDEMPAEILTVEIDKEDLFELIGSLLRIQSKLKKNG